MCGFVGFIDTKKKGVKTKIIKKMNDLIIHRGPEGEGFYCDDSIALGHRRLSIVDLELGAQPMYNEDKTLVIVFNGEIYNYETLKQELQKKGHLFKSNCDTEVLLHGYEEWGTNLLNKLTGMFSFVIYNFITKELFGARDHFGIKPFYYYHDESEFMFGSEIKSFMAHPDFKKELNKKDLKMFLIFQYTVQDETFFKNVYKLKPGHYFKLKNNKIEINNTFL